VNWLYHNLALGLNWTNTWS